MSFRMVSHDLSRLDHNLLAMLNRIALGNDFYTLNFHSGILVVHRMAVKKNPIFKIVAT